MALSSQLSDKGLARFRTKRCERILATGSCSFGDKCQYSHDTAWLRRNPTKVPYVAVLCREIGKGCAKGGACGHAHSLEEVAYHPQSYKAVLCPGGSECGGFYCPFAHTDAELRSPPLEAPTKEEQSPGNNSKEEQLVDAGAHDLGRWLEFDECIRYDSNASVSDHSQLKAPSRGRRMMGRLRTRPGIWQNCCVRFASSGRGERDEASQVVKELKKLINSELPTGSLPACLPLAVRRSVATLCIALSDCGHLGSLRPLSSCRPCLTTARPEFVAPKLLRGLLEELQQLHETGIAHLCLTPEAVLVKGDVEGHFVPSTRLHLGDFLPKIRCLSALAAGKNHDLSYDELEAWKMWLPREVQQRIQHGADNGTSISVNQFKVDSWQLGVVACFLVIGEHPFGPCSDPDFVCGNIAKGATVNLPRVLAACPALGDVLGGLLEPWPEQRLSPREALEQLPAMKPPPGLPAPVPEVGLKQSELSSGSERASSGSDVAAWGVRSDSNSPERELSGDMIAKASQVPSGDANFAELVKPGVQLRCTWQGGVRFRNNRKRSAKTDHRLEMGDELTVLERHGGWARSQKGWVPLFGVEDAFGVPLFEVVHNMPSEDVPLKPAELLVHQAAADLESVDAPSSNLVDMERTCSPAITPVGFILVTSPPTPPPVQPADKILKLLCSSEQTPPPPQAPSRISVCELLKESTLRPQAPAFAPSTPQAWQVDVRQSDWSEVQRFPAEQCLEEAFMAGFSEVSRALPVPGVPSSWTGFSECSQWWTQSPQARPSEPVYPEAARAPNETLWMHQQTPSSRCASGIQHDSSASTRSTSRTSSVEVTAVTTSPRSVPSPSWLLDSSTCSTELTAELPAKVCLPWESNDVSVDFDSLFQHPMFPCTPPIQVNERFVWL